MFLNPVQLLDQLSIPSGSRVGDFGTGAGQFALEIARRLGPEVTMYAIDPYAPTLEKVRRDAQSTGTSFYALETDLNQPLPLKDNLLNVAIVANTLYTLSNREKFLSELARVVEPGGRVLVVDWMGSFKNMGPEKDSVISPGDAANLFRNAGFTTGDVIPAGTHHFAFTATCTVT